jgi:hypothetical protein
MRLAPQPSCSWPRAAWRATRFRPPYRSQLTTLILATVLAAVAPRGRSPGRSDSRGPTAMSFAAVCGLSLTSDQPSSRRAS